MRADIEHEHIERACKRLRELLDERGYSPEEFGREIGQPTATVMKLLSGDIRASIMTFCAMVRALGCSADELLSAGDDDRPTDLGPETDAWVKSVVAQMPPMTPEQARRTSIALFGSGAHESE